MLRKSGSGGDGSSESESSCVFVFPQTGPLKPPSPPAQFLPAQLDSAYNQAVQLWPQISRQSCANALASRFADGDPSKAIVLIQFYLDAAAGYVTSVCKRNGSFLPLRGAVNYAGVSCYADSLLIAMFSRMENFEPLLYKKRYEDKATDQFATWLRLFVNLLRNGERITEDIVEALLATAVAAGWTAGTTPLSQQDAAEFFVFITEKLKMPLLALKVDIAHAGKEVEEYDHKLIREQLLYLPVPGGVQDPPILLEECLEVYFSNTINVSRHLAQPSLSGPSGIVPASPGNLASNSKLFARHSSGDSAAYPAPQSPQTVPSRHRSYSIMSLTSPSFRRVGRQSFDDNTHLSPSMPAPPVPSGNSNYNSSVSPAVTNGSSSSRTQQPPDTPPINSINGEFDPLDESESAVLPSTPDGGSRAGSEQPPEQPTPPPCGSLPSYHQLFGFNDDKQAEARVRDMKHSLWTSNNEIMLPAWMFLQLMPFYADISPNKDPNLENLEADEVANHFRQTRPVLGFCLKRYFFDDQGRPQRNNRTVIVPEAINMPSFVADDSDQKQAFGSFKLVLESAVFHRGNTIHSGHYLSLIAEDVARNRKPSTQSTSSAEAARHSWLGKQPGTAATTAATTPAVEVPPSEVSFEYTATSPSALASMLAPQNIGTADNSHQQPPSTSNSSLNTFTSTVSMPQKTNSTGKRWYLFDDLQSGGDRIKEVDYTTVFENEVPYMLFYRMVSLDDDAPISGHRKTHTASSHGSLQAASSIIPYFGSSPPSAAPSETQPQSRAPSPEPGKDKKKKNKFFRRHKDKPKDYASKYREEKCTVM